MSTVAAYRDLWHIEDQRPLGAAPGRENFDQTVQREKALAAGKWARAIGTPAVDQPNNQALEQQVEISPGIEL